MPSRPDVNVRAIIKLDNGFFVMIPKSKVAKSKTDKLDFINIKNFSRRSG